jgi:hypothetical protein
MRSLLIAAALTLLPGLALAAPEARQDCFRSSSWSGWSAPGDGDALLLQVGLHDIYRVQLVRGTHVHRWGDQFLVNRVRGGNWICSPLDLDLTLNDRMGFSQPLIAQSIQRLTPEEVAAIPRKDRPN